MKLVGFKLYLKHSFEMSLTMMKKMLLLFIITVEKYEPFHIFPLISNLKVKIAFSLLVLLLHYRILCSQHNFCLLASPTLLKYHVTAINTIAV